MPSQHRFHGITVRPDDELRADIEQAAQRENQTRHGWILSVLKAAVGR